MKKLYVMICVAMVMLSGCSKSDYLAKETTGADEKFNTDTYDITLQLTPEQQENFAYADFDIVCSVEGVGYMEGSDDPRLDEIYMFVYRGRNVELDENGILHGYYGKEAVYGYNETEERYTMIPLIVREEAEQVENEIRYTCPAIISCYKTKLESESVDMQIVVNEKYPDGVIRKVVQSDEQKILDLNKYDFIEIITGARYFTRGEDGEMIDFFDWEYAGKGLGISMDLTDGYHLERKPLDEPENYYCLFYIEDVNGNVSYSELIPIQQ